MPWLVGLLCKKGPPAVRAYRLGRQPRFVDHPPQFTHDLVPEPCPSRQHAREPIAELHEDGLLL